MTNTKALVLSKIDYQENDHIIKVFSPEYGILSFISKGTKKSKSKNNYNLNPFSNVIISFEYKENKTLFRLIKAETIDYYYYKDLLVLSLVNVMAELIENIAYDNFNEYYKLILFCLAKIEDNPYLITAFFIAKCLALAGLKPEVNHCIVTKVKKVAGINYLKGGFVSHPYLDEFPLLSKEELLKFRYLNLVEYDQLASLYNLDYNYYDLKRISDFLTVQSSIVLKSMDFLKFLD